MTDMFMPTPPSSRGERIRDSQDWLDAISKMRYASMGLIPLPDEVKRAVEGPIDPGITDLVRVVNPLGLRTQGSCEGHLDGRRHPFPWITVYGMAVSQEMRKGVQTKLLDRFNKTSKVQWVAASTIEPAVPATNEVELREMQRSAQELAEHIFERHLKGRRARYVKIFGSPFAYGID